MECKTINIKGKDYVQVDERLRVFREKFFDWSINTEILFMDKEQVVMKAVVKDEKDRVRGTGIAQEFATSSAINKTSMYENCETSAVGRAIAIATNIGNIGSICSADEVDMAIKQQDKMLEDKPITLEEAKFKTTSKGKHYYELDDKQLEFIISSDKASSESKLCAKLVLQDRQKLQAPIEDGAIEITDGDLPF